MTQTRTFDDRERGLILRLAEREGDDHVAYLFDISEETLESWRERGHDRRSRDEVSEHRLVDVEIPDGDWNGSLGCESKVAARARIVLGGKIGGEMASMRPNHHLGLPAREAKGLAPGHIILLGGERFARFSDALWEVVERGGRWRDHYGYVPTLPRSFDEQSGTFDGRPTADDPDHQKDHVLFVVRPARVRPDTQLSEDRSRLVQRTAANEKPNPLHMSLEERLANWDAQPPLHSGLK